MESRFECRGNPKIKLQACRLQNPKSLQSQNPHAARKRILLNGLEIVHGRLFRTEDISLSLAEACICAGMLAAQIRSALAGKINASPRVGAASQMAFIGGPQSKTLCCAASWFAGACLKSSAGSALAAFGRTSPR